VNDQSGWPRRRGVAIKPYALEVLDLREPYVFERERLSACQNSTDSKERIPRIRVLFVNENAAQPSSGSASVDVFVHSAAFHYPRLMTHDAAPFKLSVGC